MVADGYFFSVIVNNGKLIAQYRDGSSLYPYAPTTTDAPVDRWFHVTFELRFGPAGRVRFLVDGALLDDISANTTDSATVSSFILVVDPDFGGTAATATTTPITLHYDDIVLE
jgi:hypothetical protein